jgi:tetratricopeptide (TPR) repeat protein
MCVVTHLAALTASLLPYLQKDLLQAMQHYDAALSSDPRRVEAYVNKGQALAEQGRHAEAAGLFRRALELDPTRSPALRNLGGAGGGVAVGGVDGVGWGHAVVLCERHG